MTDRLYEEQEIDLIDLCWRLLEQWRGLVAAGLIISLLLTACMAVKQINSYNTPLDSGEVTEELGEDPNGDASVVVPVEAEKVDINVEYQNAVKSLSLYYDYIIARDTFEKSVYNNCDFEDCKVVTCMYEFEASQPSSQLLALNNVYDNIADNGDFTKSICSLFPEEMDKNSIYDILTITVSANSGNPNGRIGTISARITLPQSISADDWKKTLTDAMNAYHKKVVSGVGQHSLKFISMNSSDNKGRYLLKTKNGKINEVAIAKASYDTSLALLQLGTKRLVKRIVWESKDSYDLAAYRDELDKRWREYKINFIKEQEQAALDAGTLEGQEELTDEGDLEAEVQEPVVRPRISVVKYLILGFVLGAMLYAIAYVMLVIFIRVIRNEDEVQSATGIRNFGGIYSYSYTTKLQRFLHDKRIYEFRRRNGKKSEQIIDDLVAKLDFMDENAVTVISLGTVPLKIDEVYLEQKKLLEQKCKVSQYLNIQNTVKDMYDSDFTEVKNVFIELIGGSTKWTDVVNLIAKLKEYNITIIGSEYIEI